ncbi:MAG: hypothetical protein M1839_004340 [Geoglossum umbratile]|nr:MAG: hypothetical protein M1839_004340 [Geoglossum umbratile]
MASSNAPLRRKRKEPEKNIITITDDDEPNNTTYNVSEQQRRREKKRVQNRLSQKSCREKQASYVRQLEQFIDNIQVASGNLPSYVQQLQTSLWNCMKENQELREAILQMRKKMLSLSAAASSGADDAIFSQLIFAPRPSSPGDDNSHNHGVTNDITSGIANGVTSGNTNNSYQPKWEHSNVTIQPVTQDVQSPFVLGNYNNIPELRDRTLAVGTPQRSSVSDLNTNHPNGILSPASLVGGGQVMMSMPMQPPEAHSMPLMSPPVQDGQGHLHYQHNPHLPTSPPFAGPPLPPLQPHPRELIPPPNEALPNHLLPPPIPPEEPFIAPFHPLPTPNYDPPQVPVPDYHDAVVDAIEKQVRVAYENMRFALFKDVWETVGLPSRKFSIEQVNDIDHMTLSDVCKIALRLMLKCSLLEKYAYALGTAPITEKILRWRLHPTPRNRSAIPEPFHPTPLQHLVPNRPASIDFIHWAELRDQLILYRGNYDMRTLLKDSLDSLVREVPSVGIALPVMEYYEKIAEFGGDVLNLEEEGVESKSEYDPNQPYQPCTPTTLQGARKYGLHRLAERRLDEAFAKKYPFLDVTAITTKYPVIPWEEIGQYEHSLFKDPSVNA